VRTIQQESCGDPRWLAALQHLHPHEDTLTEEQRRLLELLVRDAILAGAHLPDLARSELQSDWRRLADLCATYDANLQRAEGCVTLARAELDGLPPRFLEFPGVQCGPDEFTVRVHLAWQFGMVMDHAFAEETRRRVLLARHALAPENAPLLRDILQLREQLAQRLAARSWAELQIETGMIGDPAAARALLTNLHQRAAPAFAAELAELRRLKIQLTGDPETQVRLWDWRYLRTRHLTRDLGFDPEAYRVFFPLEPTLEGLFALADHVFGVRFSQVQPPTTWAPGVILTVASDAATRRPLGVLYLDLFERPGKQRRFAQFDLMPPARLPNGRRQCPAVALAAGFPRPAAGQHVGLTPDDVRSLYHEFGHALHALLAETDHARLWRSRGPRDFAEVPALVFERWAEDARTVKSWAADARNPLRPIPEELLDQLRQARPIAAHVMQAEQITYAFLDLDLHGTRSTSIAPADRAAATFQRWFLPLPAANNRTFPANWDHLTGYDARYYAYLLADQAAARLVAPFHRSPLGLLDPQLGRQLREQIFAVGGHRPSPTSLDFTSP
jgi:Zn-dependent oligopeptidase